MKVNHTKKVNETTPITLSIKALTCFRQMMSNIIVVLYQKRLETEKIFGHFKTALLSFIYNILEIKFHGTTPLPIVLWSCISELRGFDIFEMI